MSSSPSAPAFVVIGRILRSHGVKGELRVLPDTDFPDRLTSLREVVLVKDGHPTPTRIETARRHGTHVLVKALGIDSPEAAQAWRGAELAVPRAQAVPLPADQHYVFEVLGVRVETENGEVLGTVTEVIRTGSNDVYVAAGRDGEVLIPAISSVVRAVDVAAGRMVIRPLPGMLERRRRGSTHQPRRRS